MTSLYLLILMVYSLLIYKSMALFVLIHVNDLFCVKVQKDA